MIKVWFTKALFAYKPDQRELLLDRSQLPNPKVYGPCVAAGGLAQYFFKKKARTLFNKIFGVQCPSTQKVIWCLNLIIENNYREMDTISLNIIILIKKIVIT